MFTSIVIKLRPRIFFIQQMMTVESDPIKRALMTQEINLIKKILNKKLDKQTAK